MEEKTFYCVRCGNTLDIVPLVSPDSLVYLSPVIEDFLCNKDALSTQITVFKNGGVVNGRNAIPFKRIK